MDKYNNGTRYLIHATFFLALKVFFIFHGSHGSHPGSHDTRGSHCDSHGSLACTFSTFSTTRSGHNLVFMKLQSA